MAREHFVSGLPLTEEEKKKFRDEERETLERGVARRHVLRSGQRYDSEATPGHRRLYRRILGEHDD
ncbi:MAG: hypothetical protein KGH79_01200 [Patescibacteria group bacterium]|nr:hypothetical protein [Patescibacteria group bacterium]